MGYNGVVVRTPPHTDGSVGIAAEGWAEFVGRLGLSGALASLSPRSSPSLTVVAFNSALCCICSAVVCVVVVAGAAGCRVVMYSTLFCAVLHAVIIS